MSIEFKLPAVGENVDTAEIGSLRVKEGEVISADQVVMDIETDKAVFELPCPHAGKITKIHVKPGDTVRTDALLLTIDESAAAGGDAKPQAAAPAAGEKTAKEPPAKAPREKEAKEPPAEKTKPAAPRSAPKAEPKPAPAPRERAPARATEKPQPPAEKPQDQAEGEELAPAPAGPATRRLARELGVDLHQVTGSGPGGRITSEDVQAYVRERLAAQDAAPAGIPGKAVAPPLPDFSKFGPIEREKLNRIMRTGAANTSLAWSVIPHVTQHELADVTELEAARKRYGQSAAAKEGGPKITMTVLAMKAVVSALKAFPRFNSSFDAVTGEVVLKKYFNIGIAVDTEQGLLVPVIRSVDSKSVVQLATELTELARKARDRKLGPEEMQGGSFTITNLGGIGGSYFTPIINTPEVAILGMSRTTEQQVVIAGKPEIRLMLPLSLSYDHRVINGADAARFIVKLAQLLSDPFQLMSEV